jgi:hypothetical protein
MDLPQLDDTAPAHQPYAAVFAKPWYGTAAIWRSATQAGFALLDTLGVREGLIDGGMLREVEVTVAMPKVKPWR